MSNKKHKNGIKLWAVVFWLIIWQLAAVVMKQEIFLVSPVSVMKTLYEMMKQREFYTRILFSTIRVLYGFTIGMLLGALIGAISAKMRFIRDLMSPLISVIRSIPVASFILLAVFFLSDGALSVFIAFLICFPVFYTNMLTGVQSADVQLLEMAHVFRLSPFKKIRHIYFPAVYPHLLSAVSVSIGLAWKSGIAAEVIAIPDGSIGERLYYVKMYYLTGELFAWTLTIVLLSLITDFACRLIVKLIGHRLSGRR
ncbi:MAG: ABC transporter permease subunit [Clostridia bacterium]|nr:ABC transporter permease subunit [Clostridia bacterium]